MSFQAEKLAAARLDSKDDNLMAEWCHSRVGARERERERERDGEREVVCQLSGLKFISIYIHFIV